jgi:triphosphoribosyl-dephospho-CoA synthase
VSVVACVARAALVEPTPRFPAHVIARFASRALWDELALDPKPGLVTLRDAGAHDDMDARTFVRSLFALRRHFAKLAAAGASAAPFDTLRALGTAAEADMLAATGGVNTHRGAIFAVGLLCAAVGSLAARTTAFTDEAIRQTLRDRWGDALSAHTRVDEASHGGIVARRHGAGGARAEAAAAFPSVFEIALPALRAARAGSACVRIQRVRALLALLAHVDDTNVLHRGGAVGLAFVQRRAAEVAAARDVIAQSAAMHCELVARRLSPGGSADLLAAALFVDAVQGATG